MLSRDPIWFNPLHFTQPENSSEDVIREQMPPANSIPTPSKKRDSLESLFKLCISGERFCINVRHPHRSHKPHGNKYPRYLVSPPSPCHFV